MSAIRIEGVQAPLGIYPESLSVEKTSPLGLAGVRESTSVDKSIRSPSPLFSPPNVEYECIEMIENFSNLAKQAGKLVTEEFKMTDEEFQQLLKEKALVMKDLVDKAGDVRSYDYLKDLSSYALVICNFVLGAFLMDSDAAEAATPAAFFMASAALAATGIAMKESSSWQSIAAMWAGDDEELQKIFTENAPLALLALAAALAAAAGDIGGMSPEIFEGLSMSQETLSILEQGIGLTTTATSSLSGVAKVRHDLAKTGLSGIEDQISFTAKTQEKSLSFFSEIKQKIKTCCETLQQMIKQRSFV